MLWSSFSALKEYPSHFSFLRRREKIFLLNHVVVHESISLLSVIALYNLPGLIIGKVLYGDNILIITLKEPDKKIERLFLAVTGFRTRPVYFSVLVQCFRKKTEVLVGRSVLG